MANPHTSNSTQGSHLKQHRAPHLLNAQYRSTRFKVSRLIEATTRRKKFLWNLEGSPDSLPSGHIPQHHLLASRRTGRITPRSRCRSQRSQCKERRQSLCHSRVKQGIPETTRKSHCHRLSSASWTERIQDQDYPSQASLRRMQHIKRLQKNHFLQRGPAQRLPRSAIVDPLPSRGRRPIILNMCGRRLMFVQCCECRLDLQVHHPVVSTPFGDRKSVV